MASIPSSSSTAARQHNAAQPLLSLPSELLVEIFALYTPVFAQPPDGPRGKASEWSIEDYEKFRLAVSETCFEFYSIIIHAPRCWTLVCIRFPAGQITGATSPSALRVWLERSFPLAFDLAIRGFDTGSNANSLAQRRCDDLADILKPHISSRCRSITFFRGVNGKGDYRLQSINRLFANIELHHTAHLAYSWVWPRGESPEGLVPTFLSKLTRPLQSLRITEARAGTPFFAEPAPFVLQDYDGPCFLFRPEQQALPALRRITKLKLDPLKEPDCNIIIRNFFRKQSLIEDLYLGFYSIARVQMVVDALLEVSSQSTSMSSTGKIPLKRLWFRPSLEEGGLVDIESVNLDGDCMLADVLRSLDRLSTSDFQVSLYPAVLRDPLRRTEVSLSELWPQAALIYASNPTRFHHKRPDWDWHWQWMTRWFEWHQWQQE